MGILDIIAKETGGERQYSDQYAISYKGSKYAYRQQEKPAKDGFLMMNVQIAVDNYDIIHNTKVREKYPTLYSEVYEHDKVTRSSWYDLSEKAYKEYQEYLEDKNIGYIN